MFLVQLILTTINHFKLLNLSNTFDGSVNMFWGRKGREEKRLQPPPMTDLKAEQVVGSHHFIIPGLGSSNPCWSELLDRCWSLFSPPLVYAQWLRWRKCEWCWVWFRHNDPQNCAKAESFAECSAKIVLSSYETLCKKSLILTFQTFDS